MIKLKRILCLTASLQEADEAVRYGVALARAYDAQLLLCHCVEAASWAAGVGGQPVTQDGKTTEQLRALLPVADRANVEVIVEEGDPTLAIPRLAAEQAVDLIVMRSRRRPLAAALLGSTAEAICRTAPCPVLVTHAAEREWIHPAKDGTANDAIE